MSNSSFAQSAVTSFAGNVQHTANYQPPAQNLNAIHWSTSINLNNSGAFAHYGAPLISSANTVFVPVKTSTNGFQVSAFNGATGAALYTLGTNYVLPSHNWIPVFSPGLATGSSGTRLYYAGAGGTIYYLNNPDIAPPGVPVQQAFYGLAAYQANPSGFNSSVFINTPITIDTSGNVFFGFRVQGTAPAPLNTAQSGFARVDPNGSAVYVLAGNAAGDSQIGYDSHNSAPALSNDQSTLYVLVKSAGTEYYGYLLGLDSTTLATKDKVFLKDPRNGNGAGMLDDSTASPMVAPDNDVYIGIYSNPDNGSRGFLLRFSSDLTTEKSPGAFGWDFTPAVVPASMVPSYLGSSPYLIFSKYNNYANAGDGDGVNKIALLDPNATQIDPHPTANGLIEMREVLTVIGVTPDAENLSSTFPYAVREWCINSPAVNPATHSIFTPSEDGHIYRWDLSLNSLSQAVQLGSGVGEPYVPTAIGPDGTIFTLNGGSLFALGNLNGVGVGLTSNIPDVRTAVAGQSLTFTAAVTNTGQSGLAPTGSVTFQDMSFQGTSPVTTTLASNVPLDSTGHAAITDSTLAAGNHFITATYGGDGNFSSGSSTMVEKIHASSSATTLTSSLNPSPTGQSVTFNATVAPSVPGSGTPTGMVTFEDGSSVLGQLPLSSGAASFSTSALSAGSHTMTAAYYSDSVFAASSGTVIQQVNGPPPATVFSPSTVPSGDYISDPTPVELGVKIRSDVSGYVTGIRFYKNSADTSVHTGSLWSTNGVLLATGTFTNETASGWQQLNFSTPVAITANTTYIASYHTGGGFDRALNFFANQGVDNAPLHELQSGADGLDGVYYYGTGGAFPNQTYEASNYWVDILFSQTTSTQPPPATSVFSPSTVPSGDYISDPTPVELGVKIRSDVSGYITGIRFYKNSADTSVHTGSLWGSGGTLLATGTFTNETASGWQQLNFSTPVAITANTTYLASYHTGGGFDRALNFFANQGVDNGTLHALESGVDGPDGVYYYGSGGTFPSQTYDSTNYWVDVVFSQNTSTPPPPATSVFSASTVPSGDYISDPTPVELGVKIRSDISGHITGIRFYKNSADTSVHTGSLWSTTGVLLATGTFTNETASGWQQLNFSTPVAITANTTYVASYHTGGGFDRALNFFANQGVDNGTLHALESGLDGLDGVYYYGSGGTFPSQTYEASNYWVDIVFATP